MRSATRPKHSPCRIPVPAAKVVLLRSTLGTGPFAQVPGGSLIMSPSNHRDPDHTDALGHFGWDVVPGFYKISARHVGCRAATGGHIATTRVYQVPPPVDNLSITLRCPHLKRAPSHLTLRFKIFQGTMTLVTVTVHGHSPTGLIAFASRGVHATLPINARTHKAVFVLPRSTRHVHASYHGDGYNKPSSARATV